MTNSNSSLKSFVIEVGGFAPDLVEEMDPSDFDLSKVDKAILFIIARWSPFPTLCLRRMHGTIPTLIRAANAKFLIIDNDKAAPELMIQLYGKPFTGGAETFAIVNGEIRGIASGCAESYPEKIEKLCSALGL